MGWLRDVLLGKDGGPAPAYGAAQEEPDPIDWAALEARLVELSVESVAAFADKHPEESFYALGFDCDSGEGQVLICANTRVAQLQAARRVDGPYRQIQLSMTEAERMASTEWGFGEWKYHGFNLRTKGWSAGWRSHKAQVRDAIDMLTLNGRHDQARELRENFMRMACRALDRLLKTKAISGLRRDPDFSVLCMDHDEGPEEGRARFVRVVPDAAPAA